MRVVLAAEEAAGARVLRRLVSGGHEVVGVCSNVDPDESAASVWGLAGRMGLQRWHGESVRDPSFATTLVGERPDVLLNVHSLHIVDPAVLDVPRFGAYNLHPGPLPRYAGLNTPSWAIYLGETCHGVTLHRMDSGIDTGTIVYQCEFPVGPRERALTLYSKCVREGLLLVDRLLEQLEVNPARLPWAPNPKADRKYFDGSVPHGGMVRWTWPSDQIVRLVRASDYHPFPSPWGTPQVRYHEEVMGIVKAEVSSSKVTGSPGTIGPVHDGAIPVATASGTVAVEYVRWKGEVVPALEVLETGELIHDGRTVAKG